MGRLAPVLDVKEALVYMLKNKKKVRLNGKGKEYFFLNDPLSEFLEEHEDDVFVPCPDPIEEMKEDLNRAIHDTLSRFATRHADRTGKKYVQASVNSEVLKSLLESLKVR